MHVVKDGRQALEYLQAAGQYADRNSFPLPSLIFLDLKLPFVQGFQVLEWINHQPALKQIPVVILTSSSEQSDRDQAQALGAQSFLVKPPTPELLRRVFQSVPGI
jgi:CheY-like chemotaxis protein